MNIFNPTKMFFSKKNIQDSENEEELIELSKEDILKTLDVAPINKQVAEEDIIKMEKTLDMKNENSKNVILNKIDVIVNAVKSALSLEETEEITETNEEVIEDAQEISEETEVVDEQPSSETEEGSEPPADEQTVETQDEVVTNEQEQQEQEEPQETQELEGECETPEEVKETEKAENVEEDEQSKTEEVKDVIETPTNIIAEQLNSEETQDEKANLLKEIENLKAEKNAKEVELKKMALSKEIESDFAGVPGKIEDKVDLVYEIQNSALADNTKNFIIDSLKSLSIQNLEDCTEIGHSQDVEVNEENEVDSKVKNAMNEHNLTEGQALLYVRGERTLAKAQEVSNKSRSKKR